MKLKITITKEQIIDMITNNERMKSITERLTIDEGSVEVLYNHTGCSLNQVTEFSGLEMEANFE